jgi:flagellar protein FliO/FliZ
MKKAQFSRMVAWLLASVSCAAGAVIPTVPTVAAEPVRSFGAAGLLQAGLGLAVVLALIFACAWLARRFGLQRTGSGHLLKVVSSVMVGQRERVVVVEIGQSWLVLGVASGQVCALHTMAAKSQTETSSAPVAVRSTAVDAFAEKFLQSMGKHISPGRPV